jgi:uncharacterized alpha-E superfamily protein
MSLASVPTLGTGQLEARHSILRAFVVLGGDSYLAMPGGITRVATADNALLSGEAGTVSKDTWVLASEPEPMTGYWPSSGPAVVAEEPEALVSSRVAENLVWLGRYAERAEGVVRVLRVVYDRRNDFADGHNPAGTECVNVLLAALTHVTETYPGFVAEGMEALRADPSNELQSLAVDPSRPGSLAFAVARLLDAAYAVRDQTSLDTGLVISSLHRDLLDVPTLGRVTLRRVLASLLALQGLGAESMVREPGWWLMDAGRRIERAVHLCSLLRATVLVERGVATDSLLMESVLTGVESIITYRRRYHSHAQLETLLDLVLLDHENPRSLAYQLDRLLEDLRSLPGGAAQKRVSAPEKPALEASTALLLVDTAALAATDTEGDRPQLGAFLSQMIDRLRLTADAIAATYYTHPLAQRAFLTPADPGAARTTQQFVR